MTVHGAEAVARQVMSGRGLARAMKAFDLRPARVNGAAVVLVVRNGQPVTMMGFTIAGGRIAEIDANTDGHYLARIAAAAAGDE
jgi:RNA polymerase sigma-70 factor (ECF subfamily)